MTGVAAERSPSSGLPLRHAERSAVPDALDDLPVAVQSAEEEPYLHPPPLRMADACREGQSESDAGHGARQDALADGLCRALPDLEPAQEY